MYRNTCRRSEKLFNGCTGREHDAGWHTAVALPSITNVTLGPEPTEQSQEQEQATTLPETLPSVHEKKKLLWSLYDEWKWGFPGLVCISKNAFLFYHFPPLPERSYKTQIGWVGLKAGLSPKGAAYLVNVSVLPPQPWADSAFAGMEGVSSAVFPVLFVNNSPSHYHH